MRRYGRLRELGFPAGGDPAAARGEVGRAVSRRAGLTLVVDPDLIGSGAPAGPILDDLRLLLEDIFRETRDADAEPSRTTDPISVYLRPRCRRGRSPPPLVATSIEVEVSPAASPSSPPAGCSAMSRRGRSRRR